MSAELLREAAEAVRAEWEPEKSGPFRHAARIHLAVADWLDAEDTHQFGPTEHAINVARAYLRRDE